MLKLKVKGGDSGPKAKRSNHFNIPHYQDENFPFL